MLTNHCLLAKIGFATAENRPSRVILRNCKSLAGSTGTSFQRERQRNLLIVHAKLDRFEQNWLCLFASAQLADSERSQGKTAFFEEKCLTNFSATLSDLGILFKLITQWDRRTWIRPKRSNNISACPLPLLEPMVSPQTPQNR